MKIKSIVYAVSLTAGILLYSSQVHALGLGAYGALSKGSYDWTYHKDEIPDIDVSSTASKKGLGLILDTNLANDSLFNYRLHVGYTKINIDNDKTFSDIEGREYHLYNSFGFGILRADFMRLWIGPQIGFGVIKGEYDYTSGDNGFWTIFASAGLIAGINFHIGDVITLGVDGGYRVNSHAGAADVGSLGFSVTGKGKEFFADISFILRINDTFEGN